MRELSEGDGAGENKERAGAATDGPMFPADEKETLKKRRGKDHTHEGRKRRKKWEVKGRKRQNRRV